MDTRKRGRHQFNANGASKKSRPEMDSLSTGVGSKSKPCTKFFSTAGCPFGESCHFLHYVPGGYNAVGKMMNLGPAPTPVSRNIMGPPPTIPGAPAPSAVKSRLCSKYNTAEGCKFGNKCNFAHGEWELGKPVGPSHDSARGFGTMPGRMGSRMEAPIPVPPAGFGASATAKISVEASLAGAVIGKGGVNSKQIFRQTGAKLSVQEHETDPNLRNIEFEGSFEQIKRASAMVSEIIASISSGKASAKVAGQSGGGASGHGHPGSNFKTKLCENFSKGSCSFGERCHFAHGASELRKSGV